MHDAPTAVVRVLDAAVAARVSPGAVLEVGTSAGAAYHVVRGAQSYADDAPPVVADTIYDLASLTKVLATVPLALRAHASGVLPLSSPVSARLPHLAVGDDITVQDLLEHAAGFPAHRPFYRCVAGTPGYRRLIAAEPAAYAPRSSHLYTDLGFMLLELLIGEAGGVSFARAFATLRETIAADLELTFGVPHAQRARVAPSGVDVWRGRMMRGLVHDGNAAALGGVAGHAGLFGTAPAVGACARWWLRLLRGDAPASSGITPALAQRAVSRGAVPGSSRGLGWDTMLSTSSCGTRLSAAAFGHTGFTGTSLWIDPARDLYVVLLTNRIHAADDPGGIRALRIAAHDAVADAWDTTTRGQS